MYFINVHFINNHLEELNLQVYKRKSQISIHGLPIPNSELSKNRARCKSTSSAINLSYCPDPSTSSSGLLESDLLLQDQQDEPSTLYEEPEVLVIENHAESEKSVGNNTDVTHRN